MSAADSDHSLDWFASDEDDCESPKKPGPERAELPPPPASTKAARSCFCSGSSKRRRSECEDGDAFRVQGLAAGTDTQHKRAELQRYLQPLASILRGLRSGRYSGRLSSFQESVAMDRIQRIMGVIQKPDMGGRFFSITVKMEAMLQSWFPHVRAAEDGAAAKKQKLQHHSSASPSASLRSSEVAPSASSHLRRLHPSPACSLKAPGSRSSPGASAPQATQDSAVSSSTDWHAGPRRRPGSGARLRRGPPPLQVISPCLERLLQAKESIIAPRTAGDGGWLPWPQAPETRPPSVPEQTKAFKARCTSV